MVIYFIVMKNERRLWMKYIVDIKCDIEGDYDIVGKYEERCGGEQDENQKV